MNFGKWFGVLALWLGSGLVAYAQVGIYAGYTGTHLSGITCQSFIGNVNNCSTTGDSSSTTSRTDSVNPSGIFFGGYYDFRTVGPVRLGADVRYIDARSNKSAASSTGGKNATSANTVLGGVRGSFHTPISWLTPYAELTAGRTNTNAASGTLSYSSYFQFEAFAGVELHVLPIVDLRPVELGIGNMNGSNGSIGVTSIGASVVFHMPPK